MKLFSLLLALVDLVLIAMIFFATNILGRDVAQVGTVTETIAPMVMHTPTAVIPLPFPPSPLPVITPTAAAPVVLPPAPATPASIIILPGAVATAPSTKPAAARRRSATKAQTADRGGSPVPNPRTLDPRLPSSVSIQEAKAAAGQMYWRLVSVRWLSPAEAQGLHHIFVEVLDEQGHRVGGQAVKVAWPGGSVTVRTDVGKPQGEAVSFPQYGLLGSYDVAVLGLPSDEIRGLGLGLPGSGWADHTCWYLLFQRSRKAP